MNISATIKDETFMFLSYDKNLIWICNLGHKKKNLHDLAI